MGLGEITSEQSSETECWFRQTVSGQAWKNLPTKSNRKKQIPEWAQGSWKEAAASHRCGACNSSASG